MHFSEWRRRNIDSWRVVWIYGLTMNIVLIHTWGKILNLQVFLYIGNVLFIKVSHISLNEFDKTENLFRLRLEEESFFILLWVFELDFSAILSFDEDIDFDSDRFFTFESKNSPESIPNELTVDSLSKHTFIKLFVFLQKNVLDHFFFVGVEFVIFFPVG